MITVIIAGGSGTRLWPLSTPEYPKHLLKINGDNKSLLQNTYERAQRISDATYVITEVSHAHHIKEQLPELTDENFVIEPARRGTASCIVAALAHINGKHDPDEPIVVLSADHFIRDADGFAHSFRVACEASSDTGRVVLVGVEPDHPATGFGYIQKDGVFDEELFVYNVHSFKEKPAHDVAQDYVRSGNYLWNCGYFVGSLNTFKSNMKAHAPQLLENYQKLAATKTPEEYEQTYLAFENDAIDYALIEKVSNLLVVPAAFDWMDLGSFSDIHKAVESDEQGNSVHGKQVALVDVENSLIQNYEDKPVAVIGLDNVAIINTPQGIVVTRKDISQKVKDAVTLLEAKK
jgi:mannose-1-phosphate guanylyltransferase